MFLVAQKLTDYRIPRTISEDGFYSRSNIRDQCGQVSTAETVGASESLRTGSLHNGQTIFVKFVGIECGDLRVARSRE